MPFTSKDGFAFQFNEDACSLCSAKCCRGRSGNIWVNATEIRNICDIFDINLIDGIVRFFEKKDNRYSIRECIDNNCMNNGQTGSYGYRCIFLDNLNKCSIYSVRPRQCRTFPFWEHFRNDMDQLRNECPGVEIVPSN